MGQYRNCDSRSDNTSCNSLSTHIPQEHTQRRSQKLETALAGRGQWTLQIVKRSDQAKGFQVLPRRWVVERTLAWFGRNRRLAKDFETTIPSSEAWLYLASVQLLARRLARTP